MIRFWGELALCPYADGKTFWLRSPIVYEGSSGPVHVPRGFETDLASTPRAFWNLVPPWGKYGEAAIVHDWLYWTQRCTRLQADNTLREAMGILHVDGWQRDAIYFAVQEFGFIAWNDNARLGKEGYSRMHVDGARVKCWKRKRLRAVVKGAANGNDSK